MQLLHATHSDCLLQLDSGRHRGARLKLSRRVGKKASTGGGRCSCQARTDGTACAEAWSPLHSSRHLAAVRLAEGSSAEPRFWDPFAADLAQVRCGLHMHAKIPALTEHWTDVEGSF